MSTKNAREFLEGIVGPLTFGMIIRSYLDREDMTQVELAKKLGVTKGYISNIVHERVLVSVAKAYEIAATLGDPPRTYIAAAIQDELRSIGMECKVELKQVKFKKAS